MPESTINAVINRIVVDDDFRGQVLDQGASALTGFDLEPAEAAAITDAVHADAGVEPFTNLRAQARFEPLFAAASASATKIG